MDWLNTLSPPAQFALFSAVKILCVFAVLMFIFNTSFLVVIANSASLVIDPHREIAGFASSAYGFITQIVASVLVVLTVPLFQGELLPWSVSLLAVTLAVFVALLAYRPALRSLP